MKVGMQYGRTPRHAGVLTAVVMWVCALSFSALAEPSAAGHNVGWVGLYDSQLLTWLENENQLDTLCPKVAATGPAWQECRIGKMKPMRLVLQMRSSPNESAASEGSLIVVGTPGQPLRAYYRAARDVRDIEFVPDLFDSDWGYGPYFHQTFLERRGSWFLLPADPMPRPAWVHLDEPTVRLVSGGQETGDLLTTPWGTLKVLAVTRQGLRARPAREVDMCGDGSAPSPEPVKEVRIPTEQLYSPKGHLLVDIAYKRGC